METILGFLIIAPPILFALTVHEYAHGWVALRFGDPTARDAGRLTLNPISHLDPIGTIMLFLIHLGWAKPVPVNPYYFRNPRKDMMWVSLAGPGANMLVAFCLGVIIRFLNLFPAAPGLEASFFGVIVQMIVFGLVINLILAFFNLLPIPPLDGSKILMGILPPQYEEPLMQLERFGPFLLIAIIFIGRALHIPILWGILSPFVSFFSYVFAGADLSRFL
jgi:Zn-dependent protease